MRQNPTLNEFLTQIAKLTPGSDYGVDTALSDMSPYERVVVTRWLSDALTMSTALEIIEQFKTLGDAWKWLEASLSDGSELRSVADSDIGRSTRVRLRPVANADIHILYEASFNPATAGRWGWRGRTVPIEHFAATFFDGIVAQFIVEMNGNGAPVGLVRAYDDNPLGLHCKIAFQRCGPRQPGDAGVMVEGVCLFITYLFSNFPYRKLYAEVPSYNMGLFAPGFADDEAVLRDYLFHGGRFVDLHIVSISRKQAAQLRDATGW